MLTCKNCKEFENRNRWCHKHHQQIHDTLLATYCKGYAAKRSAEPKVICRNCSHFQFNAAGKRGAEEARNQQPDRKGYRALPYWCEAKSIGLMYAAKVVCDRFYRKESK